MQFRESLVTSLGPYVCVKPIIHNQKLRK